MLLTSRIVRPARPRERRYILADEHGMSLHVMPWGSKWWRFRYRFQHTERMISLGVYPYVTLATARLLHADARGLLARDIDPSADRKEKRAANARAFELVARQWFKLLQPRVAKGQLAADTLKDATRILERHVFPTLGARPICHITRVRHRPGITDPARLGELLRAIRRIHGPRGHRYRLEARPPLLCAARGTSKGALAAI